MNNRIKRKKNESIIWNTWWISVTKTVSFRKWRLATTSSPFHCNSLWKLKNEPRDLSFYSIFRQKNKSFQRLGRSQSFCLQKQLSPWAKRLYKSYFKGLNVFIIINQTWFCFILFTQKLVKKIFLSQTIDWRDLTLKSFFFFFKFTFYYFSSCRFDLKTQNPEPVYSKQYSKPK